MTDTNGKSEPQVYNQFICIESHSHEYFHYIEGQMYFFHEDASIWSSGKFVMVVDRQGFPVGVTAIEIEVE